MTYLALVFVCFCTLECISNICSFLQVTSYLVKKFPMENESNISLGGIIILLALFAQKYIFGQRYILSQSSYPVSHFKTTSKVQKVIVFTISKKNKRQIKEENTISRMSVGHTIENASLHALIGSLFWLDYNKGHCIRGY